jgi:hypothetical protein
VRLGSGRINRMGLHVPGQKFFRIAAIVVAVVALDAPSALAQPQAPQPTWRISDIISQTKTVASLNAVTVLDPADAWAAGQIGKGPLIEQFIYGKAWVNVTPPASKIKFPASSATAIGASSNSNVWVLGSGRDGYAAQWNGVAWRLSSFHQNLHMTGAEVFTPTDAWAFGETGAARAFAARYNGRIWQRISMPGVPFAVSELSPKSVWAAGPVNARQLSDTRVQHPNLLMQWNGRSWKSVRLPSLALPKSEYLKVNGVLACNARTIWVSGEIVTIRGKRQSQAVLLHWNGSTWRTFRSPVNELSSMASDGRGGIWAVTSAYKGTATHFVHFNGRRWTVEAAPLTQPVQRREAISLAAIAWIPDTYSVWSVGALTSTAAGHDAIVYWYGA